MSKEVLIAGLRLDAVTKPELLGLIEARMNSGKKTFMTTLYSEFLYAALRDREVKAMLNKADIAVADGVGILWAHYFMSKNFSFHNFYLKIIQAWWQVIYTGASIILSPRSIYKTFPEKIVGADLVWDLARFADDKELSLYLVGWHQQETHKVKEILEQKFPRINIVGAADTIPTSQDTLADITSLKPDIVLVAFGPLKQERWILSNLNKLPIKFAIGLGGTFDYILGKVAKPPRFVRSMGLEWLYRLFTQPQRLGRIMNATFGLMLSLVRYKVFESCGLRPNATAVVRNQKNEILIVQRNPDDPFLLDTDGKLHSEKFANYWQFPRGGIERNESAEAGAKRELYEEVRVTSVVFDKVSPVKNSYEWNNAVRRLFGNVYQYRGQEQSIVYFIFKGEDLNEPKPDGRELIAYKWVKLSELRNHLHPEQSELISIIEKDLNIEK